MLPGNMIKGQCKPNVDGQSEVH